ncbi:unnamed protein product [Caenorhabditis bovis]|uniref:Uncharacterized protein n=1 Tax=Caenorhabditis bovis TaxID=2654633 RepID=A0A8S1ELL6_9PELO|nr:unnamed protein product [Caenorhabditis bovis]
MNDESESTDIDDITQIISSTESVVRTQSVLASELVGILSDRTLKCKQLGETGHDVIAAYRDKKHEFLDDAASQDNLLENIMRNEAALKLTTQKIAELQALQEIKMPPMINNQTSTTSSRSFSSDSLMNSMKAPLVKPIPVQLFTIVARVMKELTIMRNTLHTGDMITAYIDEISKQSNLVTKMCAKEFPPQSLQDYLETLPSVRAGTYSKHSSNSNFIIIIIV